MKAELVPLDGSAPIRLTKEITIIGRREFCDVQIEHPGLSKRHCILIKTDGLLLIRDLATTNGTKVKGQRIKWAALLPDDQVTIGRLRYHVYFGPDGLPSPSEKRLGGEASIASKNTDPIPPLVEVPLPTLRVASLISTDDKFEALSDLIELDDDIVVLD